MKVPSFKRLALLVFVVTPVVAWFAVKPIRVVAPEAIGITCPVKHICVDDVTRFQDATTLYSEGMAFLASNLIPLKTAPKVIFCSTVACAESFGLGARSAVTVARLGTVVGPNAWKSYYVRHEMIHVLQSEQIGVIPLLFKPSWFVEGMAYALSEDPRETLRESFQTDRQLFRKWYETKSRDSVWSAAKNL